MNRNPFLTRRGRIIAAALCLVVAPTAYLASYPVTYRIIVGSDANEDTVPYLANFCVGPLPSEEAWERYQTWKRLEKYYFPPAEWLIDYTPVQSPMLALARILDVDAQMTLAISNRGLDRALQALLWSSKVEQLDGLSSPSGQFTAQDDSLIHLGN